MKVEFLSSTKFEFRIVYKVIAALQIPLPLCLRLLKSRQFGQYVVVCAFHCLYLFRRVTRHSNILDLTINLFRLHNPHSLLRKTTLWCHQATYYLHKSHFELHSSQHRHFELCNSPKTASTDRLVSTYITSQAESIIGRSFPWRTISWDASTWARRTSPTWPSPSSDASLACSVSSRPTATLTT